MNFPYDWKNHWKRPASAALLLAGLLGLTACSSNEADTSASPAASAPAAVSSPAAPSPAASPSAAPAPAATAAPSAAGTPADASSAPAGTADSGDADVRAQLKEMLALAKQGKAPGIEFADHADLIDDVKAVWGKPDRDEFAGKGMYATYTDERAAIGYNKGSRIFDIRSSAADIQALTFKQVEETLGKPDSVAKSGDDTIYVYQASDNYQLKFAVPKSKGTVDHISVFSEKDSFNNMQG